MLAHAQELGGVQQQEVAHQHSREDMSSEESDAGDDISGHEEHLALLGSGENRSLLPVTVGTGRIGVKSGLCIGF
jgi:hypothetical protein